VGTLDALADRYRDRVSFLAVYIREAHPEEGWILPENRRSGVAVDEPQSDETRREVAASCATALRLRMPMVVDAVDNAVASAYGGWRTGSTWSAATDGSPTAAARARLASSPMS